MSIESVTQAVSNLALQFGDDDAGPGAMVMSFVSMCTRLCGLDVDKTGICLPATIMLMHSSISYATESLVITELVMLN